MSPHPDTARVPQKGREILTNSFSTIKKSTVKKILQVQVYTASGRRSSVQRNLISTGQRPRNIRNQIASKMRMKYSNFMQTAEISHYLKQPFPAMLVRGIRNKTKQFKMFLPKPITGSFPLGLSQLE